MLVVLAAALSACMSAQEKCDKARSEAAGAWEAYASVMAAARDQRRARIKDIATAMRGDINERLSQRAAAEASRLHRQGTAEWHRAYTARQQAGCTSDPECSKLRLERATAEHEAASLDERISAARRAKQAARETPKTAREAVEAVEEDFEFAEVKLARASSEVAHEACSGLQE